MNRKHLSVVGVLLMLAGNAAALPPDLDAVPRDAAAFLHLRTADIWKNDAVAEVRHFVQKAGPEAIQEFQKMFVPDPAEIERVTFVAVNTKALGQLIPYRVDPENVSALVILATKTPFDRFKVIDKLGFREKFYKRNLYYFNEELWTGLVLIDDKTLLFGAEDSVVAYFDQAGTRTGPLQAALEEADKPHLAVAGWNPQTIKGDDLGTVPLNIQPLFKAQCMLAAFDIDKQFKLDLRFEFADADKATEGGKALQEALDMFRGLLILPINQVEAQLRMDPEKVGLDDLPERFAMLFALGFLRDLEDMLKNAKIETKDKTVRYPFEYSKVATAQQSTLMMMFFISALGRSASATFSQVGAELGGKGNPNEDHLRKVAEAMEKYHADKGHYPPAAILDKDGRPILSWRVALLPYLNEQEVYSQFNMDEPWDSLNNKKLLKKMPQWLRRADRVDHFGGERMKSVDFIVAGPGTPFASKTPKRGDFAEKSVFLLFTESGDAGVYWTKPADLKHQAGQPLARLFGENARQVHVLFKDGSYKAFKKEDEKALRDLLEAKK